MAIDLSTNYLGLKLKHPLVAGASPLVDYMDQVKALEDGGVAAVVMHSLFEEQIIHSTEGAEAHVMGHEGAYAEATSYFPSSADYALGPEAYLEQIGKVKEAVSVPVIGSLNGTHLGGWIEHAKEIEQAGADALELNLYDLPTDATRSSSDVERAYADVVFEVGKAVEIPLAVKISTHFTSLPNLARRFKNAGASGLVLFNRFYQPDIDIEELEMAPRLKLSTSNELLPRLRWLAILHNRFDLDLACSGGVHQVEDVVKAVMSGADCVQLVSCLLLHGPAYLAKLTEDLVEWMESHEYNSIEQMKGSMSYRNTPNPEAIERANYLKILQSWRP